MKVLLVEDYEDFECIGDKCLQTCCGGRWMIVVDNGTAVRYLEEKGEFGDLLREKLMKHGDDYFFQMDDNGYCCFLDEKGLCRIYKTLGPDSLCDVCATYPRNEFYVGDICFRYLSTSCPEVLFRIFNRNHPLQFDFVELTDVTFAEENIDWNAFNLAIRCFTTGMDILQDRGLNVAHRIALLMVYVFQFQTSEGKTQNEVIDLFSTRELYMKLLNDIQVDERKYAEKIRAFTLMFSMMLEKADNSPMWGDCIKIANMLQEQRTIPEEDLGQAFGLMDRPDLQMKLEQLFCYRYYTVFMQGFKEKDYFERLVNECVCMMAMIGFAALNEIVNGYASSECDMICFYSLVSRMTDHRSEKYRKNIVDKIKENGFCNLESVFRLVS